MDNPRDRSTPRRRKIVNFLSPLNQRKRRYMGTIKIRNWAKKIINPSRYGFFPAREFMALNHSVFTVESSIVN